MKTGYGLNTADSLGYLGYGSKPYSSLNYLGSKGYSSTSASGIRTKSALDKDTIMSKVKKPKLRKTSTDKVDVPLYKKKTFDFTDYAYREAVNRLKFLLTEAYEPTKAATSFYYRTVDDGKSEVSDSQSVVERPSLTEVSKYFPSTAVSRYGGGGGGTLGRRYSFLHRDPMGAGHAGTSPGALKPALSNSSLHPSPSVIASQSLEVAQPPPELLGFIEKQESYIEQLERESQYCREELSTLLKKVKDVVSENEALTDRTRGKGPYQLDSSESEDVDYLDRVGRDGKKSLSGPNIVFESRISELEAQLAQSQIDLKKLFNENEDNKRKLLHGASDVGNADAYRKQVENLQRDKQNLEETVRKLQLSIDQLKDSEACNFNKSQRSRDMIEQVAFERNQAEIEIRRLKDELERQHERVREVQHEMAKRLAEERSNAERRYTYHVDQLGGDLSSQWEHATKLQLEVERMKRIESDYKRELNQKNTQIDELKMELKNKSAIFMSDLNQGSAEKQSLEQEITSLRLQLERTERQAKVEVSRLNAEITSLRQRLDRADADLLHSKRENLKLADDVSSLEKELTLGELNRETRPSKELAKIISDMEAKHTNTVSELEGMIQDQKQLMEKLTAECKSLTHKLEDTTQKHKEEKRELRQTNSELMERLKQIWTNYKQISPAFRKSSMAGSSCGDLREAPIDKDGPHEQQSTLAPGPEVPQHDTHQHRHHPTVALCHPQREPSMTERAAGNTVPEQEPASPLDPSHAPPIASSTPRARSSRPSCPETIPSSTTAASTRRARDEASHGCHAARSPTMTEEAEEEEQEVEVEELARLRARCGPEAFQRSRSMDAELWSRSVCREPAIPLNRTAPEAEAAGGCRGNPWPTSSEPHANRCSHLSAPRDQPDMGRNRCNMALRTQPMQQQQQQQPRMDKLNSHMETLPTSRPAESNISRWTTNQPVPCTVRDTIPPSSNSSTMDTESSSSSSTINSRPTTSSSTKAISNHMMHSSTPLSRFMMNPATPPEAAPCSSLQQHNFSHLHNYPHQPYPHLPQHQHQHQHQQQQQHPLQHLHQQPVNSSSSQENPQSQWNRRKATELWGVHVPVRRPGQEPTDSDTSNRPARDGKVPCCHPSSSRPRQQLPKTLCDFQPIDCYPHLSISSPSLFGSSPDASLTPSPTSTVLKNYDAASPNPH